MGKWVDLLKTAYPGISALGPDEPHKVAYPVVLQRAQQGARAFSNIELLAINVRGSDGLKGAFVAIVGEHIDGLICWARVQVVARKKSDR